MNFDDLLHNRLPVQPVPAAVPRFILDRSEDRRSAPRVKGLEQRGLVSLRIRPGDLVVLVDLSSGGALFETVSRLSPGSSVDLHLDGWRQRLTISGSVVRCEVARLNCSQVRYRAAVAFHHQLCLLGGWSGEYVVPSAGRVPVRPNALQGVRRSTK